MAKTKISSDSTVIHKYITPYIGIAAFGLFIYFLINDGLIIFLPVLVIIFLIAMLINKAFLFFFITDVFIDYADKKIETGFLPRLKAKDFKELTGYKRRFNLITLKFEKGRAHFIAGEYFNILDAPHLRNVDAILNEIIAENRK